MANSVLKELYSFWFQCDEPAKVKSDKNYKPNVNIWWRRIEPFRGEAKTKFSTLLADSLARLEQNPQALNDWKANQDPNGYLALVILLCEINRTIHIGTAESFKGDKFAIDVAREAIEKGEDKNLAPIERAVLYKPFLYSEKLEDTSFGAECFVKLNQEERDSIPSEHKKIISTILKTALKNKSTIEKFGRDPERNKLLSRETTVEEKLFLKNKKKQEQQFEKRDEKAEQKGQGKKLKILVFHGYTQNAGLFKQKTGKLRKALGDFAELIYVNGIHNCVQSQKSFANQRCYWNSNEDGTVYHGAEQTLVFINDIFATQGPFDGVIGFSQGGVLAAILSALQPHNSINFKFVVLISAFAPRAIEYQKLFSEGTRINTPSFHITGLKDVLVDPERSKHLASLFTNKVESVHSSGHFAPDAWPVSQMVSFISQFKSAADQPLVINKQSDNVALSSLNDKLQCTLLANKTGVPIGISANAKQLLQSELWLKKIQDDKVDISNQELGDWVNEALDLASSPSELTTILEDVITIAFSARFHNTKFSAHTNKQPEIKRRDFIFFTVLAYIFTIKPKIVLDLLPLIPKLTSWRDLVGIETAAHRVSVESKANLEELRKRIIDMFISQLQSDQQVLSTEDTLPSSCALGAPRSGTAADKETKISKAIARALFQTTESITDTKEAKWKCYNDYRILLTKLSTRLQESSSKSISRKEEKRRVLLAQPDYWMANNSKNTPVPNAILNPEPEPVTVAPIAELAPLLQFLKDKLPVNEQTAFTRGTLLPDGRLDLCKQVVGNTGITPLMDSMDGNSCVKRLLLGNNIVGNTGAKRIAQSIKNGATLTTWYIAGNDIDAEGISHVCEALENNTLVDQLWLKRNPLKPEGAIPIAKLLVNNSYLQVLDLVNTGLLDEGVKTIFESLPSNTTLRHLYLGSNGITAVGAKYAADYVANHNKLISLFFSLNRLGDEGAKVLAEGLSKDRTLERLSVASNRLSSIGVGYLVDVIKHHPKIQLVDFGFTRATSVLGELGNSMGDEGALKIAELIKENNRIRSLDVLHNAIGQNGINSILEALKNNTSLVTLNIAQFGKSHTDTSIEEIKALIERNKSLLDPATLQEVLKIDTPDHIAEIYSVYRTHQ